LSPQVSLVLVLTHLVIHLLHEPESFLRS